MLGTINEFLRSFYSPYYMIGITSRLPALLDTQFNSNMLEVPRMTPIFSDSLDSLDWRDYGIVSPVRDQQQCGSCWAFSSIGAIEGMLSLRGTNITLSEQQLIDCIPDGCSGHDMAYGFNYATTHDLCPYDEYPYEAHTTACRTCDTGIRINGHYNISRYDEELLKKAVKKQPISVGIASRRITFNLYKSGVYGDPNCKMFIDHAVLLVGYGTDPIGGDYWIIKNSWGTDWGEDGYMRLQRNYGGEGMCGITLMASYPY